MQSAILALCWGKISSNTEARCAIRFEFAPRSALRLSVGLRAWVFPIVWTSPRALFNEVKPTSDLTIWVSCMSWGGHWGGLLLLLSDIPEANCPIRSFSPITCILSYWYFPIGDPGGFFAWVLYLCPTSTHNGRGIARATSL